VVFQCFRGSIVKSSSGHHLLIPKCSKIIDKTAGNCQFVVGFVSRRFTEFRAMVADFVDGLAQTLRLVLNSFPKPNGRAYQPHGSSRLAEMGGGSIHREAETSNAGITKIDALFPSGGTP
jgi:hypothetical protein